MTGNYSKEQILDFISQFQKHDVIDTFSNGMCYWFAEILKTRFPGGTIMYNDILNHYTYYYDCCQYDITGVKTNFPCGYAEDWNDFKLRDELLTCRLYRDCINKTEVADCGNCINNNCKMKGQKTNEQ